MPNYGISLNQRLQGLLFTTRYYILAEDEATLQSEFTTLMQARAALQTQDVEYLNALAWNETVQPVAYIDLALPYVRGENDGHTAPSANFLTIVYHDSVGGRTSERVRGYSINELTEDSIFSIDDSGSTDPVEPDSGADAVTTVHPYGIIVRDYVGVRISGAWLSGKRHVLKSFSTRVSTGSKQIKRVV